MKRKEHHVVPNKGKWDVKRDNAERASRKFERKQDAIEYARKQSRKEKTELVIHRKDGTIQNSDSHGNDLCPPKDKR